MDRIEFSEYPTQSDNRIGLDYQIELSAWIVLDYRIDWIIGLDRIIGPDNRIGLSEHRIELSN